MSRSQYQKVLAVFAIRILLFIKILIYKYILSENRPTLNKTKVITPTQFVGSGFIKVSNVQLGVWPSPHIFASGYLESRNSEASILIEDGTIINNNFTIIADKSTIKIGRRCLIGPNFFCTDSDFHGLEINKRRSADYCFGDVIIEDDVFIGDSVKVMKAITIGRGAVIAAGSVVTSDVEPLSVYAGVPAKKIHNIKC